MIITKTWAMPSRNTFQIKPIKELLSRYVPEGGKNWVDPFSGNSKFAEYTNDLNPNTSALVHSDALDFCWQLDNSFQKDGVLWDPPYSLRQLKECYNSIDKKMTFDESQDASFSKIKTILAPKIKQGGYAISFGWNTNGFGTTRGFEQTEIMLVAHGGHHNDTLVTVERKRV